MGVLVVDKGGDLIEGKKRSSSCIVRVAAMVAAASEEERKNWAVLSEVQTRDAHQNW